MSPRKYDRQSRLIAAEETRKRIVRATVELHAEHGALGTTHEMLAKRAGVSLPTVYKYFPTRNDLMPECTGLVFGQAPVPLDSTIFTGLDDPPSRLRALAHRTFELHEYAAPWMRWAARDATELPALREILDQVGRGRSELIRAALKPGFNRRSPPRRLVAIAAVLLDFSSWQALTGQGWTTQGAASTVGDALSSLYSAKRKDKNR